MNVEKSKVLSFSKPPSQVKIMIDQKQLRNVKYVNCFGCQITSDARCTHEIKSRISTTRATFKKNKKKKKTSFPKTELKFTEMLHSEHRFVWC
jgi:hypothetical protein